MNIFCDLRAIARVTHSDSGTVTTVISVSNGEIVSIIASTATAPERRWRFARDGEACEQEVAPSYVTNSAEAAIWHAARDGGLTQVLGYQVIDQVRSGALAVVLAEYESPAFPIHFVYPTSRLLSAKVRTLIDTAAAEDWNFTAF